MKIAKETVVTMHYTLKNNEGVVMDSSQGREPLIYLHGVGALIPGLELELTDKIQGDKISTVVTPEHAYGERRDDLIREVSKDGFQGEEELEVGMQVQLDTDRGQTIAVVSKIEGDTVILDLNHPLAGVTLHFDVEITDVRAASKEEIAHGHVHGHGGHHH